MNVAVHNYRNHCSVCDKNNDDSSDIPFFSFILANQNFFGSLCFCVLVFILFIINRSIVVACWNWFNSHIVCIFNQISNQHCASRHLLYYSFGHSGRQRLSSVVYVRNGDNKFSALIAFIFGCFLHLVISQYYEHVFTVI